MNALHPTVTAPLADPRRPVAVLVTFHLVAAAALLVTGWSTPFLMDGESPLINYLTPIALGLLIVVVELTRFDPVTLAKAWAITLAVNAGAVVFILPAVILYTTLVATVTALVVCAPVALVHRLRA